MNNKFRTKSKQSTKKSKQPRTKSKQSTKKSKRNLVQYNHYKKHIYNFLLTLISMNQIQLVKKPLFDDTQIDNLYNSLNKNNNHHGGSYTRVNQTKKMITITQAFIGQIIFDHVNLLSGDPLNNDTYYSIWPTGGDAGTTLNDASYNLRGPNILEFISHAKQFISLNLLNK